MAAIVAFHAHPDDEVLLTGGTIAALAAQGHRATRTSRPVHEVGARAAGLAGVRVVEATVPRELSVRLAGQQHLVVRRYAAQKRAASRSTALHRGRWGRW